MRFTPALFLASGAALVAAAPTPSEHVHVQPDEVMLFGSGRHQIMKRSDFAALEAARKNPPPMPPWVNNSMPLLYGGKYIPPTGSSTNTTASPLVKRDRDTILIIGPEEPKYLDWDLAMSTTVKSNDEYQSSIGTMESTSISNAITTGAGVDLKIIKDVFSVNAHVDYTHTWTTGRIATTTLYVPKGQYGVAVINAWTWRTQGSVWSGIVGESGEGAGVLTPFSAYRHAQKSWQGFDWVDGVVSVCASRKVPVRRCNGEGEL